MDSALTPFNVTTPDNDGDEDSEADTVALATVPTTRDPAIDEAVFACVAIIALDEIIAEDDIVADAIDVGLLLTPTQSTLAETMALDEIVADAIDVGLFEIPFQSAEDEMIALEDRVADVEVLATFAELEVVALLDIVELADTFAYPTDAVVILF